MFERFASSAAALVLLVAACAGCDSSSSDPPEEDGGVKEAGGGEDAEVPPGFARLTGRTLKLGSKTQGVAAATVTVGTEKATTDAMGNWSMTLPVDQAFSPVFAAEGYATLTEESATLSGTFEKEPTPLTDRATGQLLVGFLMNYDKNLGIMAINVVAESSCPDEAGATLSVTAGGSKVGSIVYFVGGLPSSTAMSTQKGVTPAAIAYNLPLGEVSVEVQHPSCMQQLPPVSQGSITYHGKVQVAAAQPSEALAMSFLRAFLK
jgi:hypothetical protein